MSQLIKKKPAHCQSNHQKVTLKDFKAAIKCADLCELVPTIAQLNPEEVFDLWKKAPPNLSKVRIFTAAIALCVDKIAKDSKK